MAKKEVRIITASTDIAKTIDEGAKIKTEIDSLTTQDKNLKSIITEVAKEVMEHGETSIKLRGLSFAALVSASEKVGFDIGAEQYPAMLEAVRGGLLTDVVSCKKNITVPPGSVDGAAEALEAAGIKVTVTETMTVKADDVRRMKERESSSFEETSARKSLEECLSSDITFRVKYEGV